MCFNYTTNIIMSETFKEKILFNKKKKKKEIAERFE